MGAPSWCAAAAAAMLLIAAAAPKLANAQTDSAEYVDYPEYEYGDYADYAYGDAPVDEEYGYDYDYEHMPGDCEVLDESVVKVNGTEACDVRLSGSNDLMDGLDTGLDGVYEITGCFAGHPLYTRKNSPGGAGRTLFFDPLYLDWNVVEGETTQPLDNGELFGFGGSGIGEERPQLVVSDGDDWVLGTDYSTKAQTDDATNPWFNADIQVTCENQVGVNVRFEGRVHESQVREERSTTDDFSQAWDTAIQAMEEQMEAEAKDDPHQTSTLSNKANDDWYASHGQASVTATDSPSASADAPSTSGSSSSGTGHIILGVLLFAGVVAGVGGYVFWLKRNSARSLSSYESQLPSLAAGDDDEGAKLIP